MEVLLIKIRAPRLASLASIAALSGTLLSTGPSAGSDKLDPRNTVAQSHAAAPAIPAPVAPAGADGQLGTALLGARVEGDGTLLVSSGATSSTRFSTGEFEVDFNRDVTNCLYTANAFNVGYSFELQGRGGNPNGIFVLIEFRDGSMTDVRFDLQVFCPR